MCADWKKDYAPDPVLAKIGKTARVHENGKTSYITSSSVFGMEDLKHVLASGLVLSAKIPSSLHADIVGDGINDALCKAKGKLTREGVMQAVREVEGRYLRLPKENYVLATSISLKCPLPYCRLRRDKRCIIFTPSLPKSFDQSSLRVRVSTLFHREVLPNDYYMVRTGCTGRNFQEAAVDALDTLALFRGIWNFWLTRGRASRSLCGDPDQVAEISLDPIRTLHMPNGKLATDTIWYDSHYRKPVKCKKITSKAWLELREVDSWTRKRMSRSKDGGDFLTQAFIRYAVALDEPSMDHTFLRLWSLLEFLTQTTKETRSKTTIRRAAFLCSEREYAIKELEHFRDMRNRAVHEDDLTRSSDIPVYQLKSYVDRLLLFLLVRCNMRETKAEMAEFLDSPCSLDALEKKIRMYRKAKVFLGKQKA